MRKLETYEDWRHCIEVLCGIPLSKDYVAERICVLSDTTSEHTIKFVKTWGEQHRQRVLKWFGMAASELAEAASGDL